MLPLSCFWTIVVITHASRCGVASISLQSSRTPFLSALLAVEPSLRHRYFFPGHSNAFIPPAFDGLTSIRDVFQYDLPELDGLDNIHAPEGPLLEALELAAQHFQVSKTWFLVNGSTSGILTAILSCFRIFKQSKIATTTQPTTTTGYFLIGRDAHKSVYDAVELTGCNSIVLPCHVDSVCGISLGVDFSTLEATLLRYENQVHMFSS
jgi:lysine decarboxylase